MINLGQTGWYEIRRTTSWATIARVFGHHLQGDEIALVYPSSSTANTTTGQPTDEVRGRESNHLWHSRFHPSISVSAPYEVTTDTGTKQVVAISGGNLVRMTL
jgi:hypothetical protein